MSRELAGYTSPHHEGAWSNTKNYTPLSVVTNNGSSYIAKKAVPAGTALNNSVYWGLLASVGSDPNITITKTSSVGLVDTYTWTDATSGNTGTFTVTNGQDGEITGDVIATPYDNTAAYKVGILLTDGGKLYYCKKSAPAGTPVTNTEYFRDASVAGDFISIIKVIDQGITLGDINTLLNGTGGINPQGLHIMFDVGALGASMYLCTIFIDADAGVYKIFDIVLGRVAEGTYSSTKLLSMAIANADTIATQSQIDDLQEQVNELGGKSLIKDWDTLGEQIKAGTSQNYIHIGDTVEVNWNKTVLGVTTPSSLTVTCTDRQAFIQKMGEAEAKDYLFVYDGANWTYNESTVVLSEYGLSITGAPVTGEVMTITTTVEKVSYTFVSYDTAEPTDSELAHNWLLEQTYAPTTRVFDTYESLFNLAQGNTLTAGAYKLTAYSYLSGANVTVYFNVPADITATDGDIQFASQGYQNVSGYIPSAIRPVYKGSTTYLANSISITKTEITGATDVSTVTGVSVGVIDQATFGDNDWGYSNLRAFLNNTQAGNHYEPSWAFDRPTSYSTGDGFLYCIDPRVLALIQACNVKCTAGYGHDDHPRNSTYTVSDKVFLLSMKEMSFDINTAEGTLTQLYGSYTNNTLTNDAVASRAKYNKAGGTLNSYRWSRSAYASYANYARIATSAGSHDGGGAVGGRYVAPAFIIGKI